MNILITGVAGFIGFSLARQSLERADARVITVDKLTRAGNINSLVSKMRFILFA